MEQMAVAASGETTFGVIKPQQSRPPDVFSLNRGHDFEAGQFQSPRRRDRLRRTCRTDQRPSGQENL